MATLPTVEQIDWQIKHISDDMSSKVIVVNSVCFAIACLAVILRFQSRRMAKVKCGLDDWLTVVGLFLFLGFVTISLLGVRYGSGKHAILLKDIPSFVKLLLSAEVVNGFAISAIKGSILALYHRLFGINRGFRIAVWVVAVFTICYCLLQSFLAVLGCMPVRSTWTIGVKHHCNNIKLGGTTLAAINVLTDFIILILPMPILYKLQQPMRQKIQIMGIFLLGGLVCFASVYRCVVTWDITFYDATWSDVPLDIWSVVEISMGIWSACLPTMRPLFSRSTLFSTSKFSLRSASGSGHEKGTLGSHSDRSPTVQQSGSVSSNANIPHTPSQTASFEEV